MLSEDIYYPIFEKPEQLTLEKIYFAAEYVYTQPFKIKLVEFLLDKLSASMDHSLITLDVCDYPREEMIKIRDTLRDNTIPLNWDENNYSKKLLNAIKQDKMTLESIIKLEKLISLYKFIFPYHKEAIEIRNNYINKKFDLDSTRDTIDF